MITNEVCQNLVHFTLKIGSAAKRILQFNLIFVTLTVFPISIVK